MFFVVSCLERLYVLSTTSTRFLASEFWWQNDVGWFGQRPAGVVQFSWQGNDISKRPKISDALNFEYWYIRIRLGSSIHKTWRPTLKSAVRTINNFTYFLFCDSFFICFSTTSYNITQTSSSIFILIKSNHHTNHESPHKSTYDDIHMTTNRWQKLVLLLKSGTYLYHRQQVSVLLL
jgi:hypothetical protein